MFLTSATIQAKIKYYASLPILSQDLTSAFDVSLKREIPASFMSRFVQYSMTIIWWQWFDMAIETAISITIYLKHYAFNLFALEVMTQWTSTADDTLLICLCLVFNFIFNLIMTSFTNKIYWFLLNRDVMNIDKILNCVSLILEILYSSFYPQSLTAVPDLCYQWVTKCVAHIKLT